MAMFGAYEALSRRGRRSLKKVFVKTSSRRLNGPHEVMQYISGKTPLQSIAISDKLR